MPERIFWKHLKGNQLGYKFRRQHGIGDYIVDFYCPQLKLVVEIDGRVHGEESIAKKDLVREEFLKLQGLNIKHFTAEEVNNQLEVVLEELKNYCDHLALQMASS